MSNRLKFIQNKHINDATTGVDPVGDCRHNNRGRASVAKLSDVKAAVGEQTCFCFLGKYPHFPAGNVE